MKVDLNKTFINLEKKVIGEELKYAVAERKPDGAIVPINENGQFVIATIKGQPDTLRKVAQEALLIDGPDEKLSKEEKMRRSNLGMKILLSETDEVDLEVKDITFLQDLIYAKKDTLIAGQAAKHLEPKE